MIKECKCGIGYDKIPYTSKLNIDGHADGWFWNCSCGSTLFMPLAKALKANARYVIEVDQWTSSGDIRNVPFDKLFVTKINGPAAETAVDLEIASMTLRLVLDSETPQTARVWFVKDPNGMPYLWKANYDSS